MEGRVEPPVYLGPDELARLYSVEDFESLARERMAELDADALVVRAAIVERVL